MDFQLKAAPMSLRPQNTLEYELEPSTNFVTTLRSCADRVEGIFGQLLALQHRVFPELPAPVWAWQA